MAGFVFGILMKVYVQFASNPIAVIEPFGNQSIFNWAFCVVVCVAVSLATAPPKPEQVTDTLTINWRQINIFGGLGRRWYESVILWWGGFAVLVATLILLFSGLFS